MREEVRMMTDTTEPKYSESVTCPNCDSKDVVRESDGLYKCTKCGYKFKK